VGTPLGHSAPLGCQRGGRCDLADAEGVNAKRPRMRSHAGAWERVNE